MKRLAFVFLLALLVINVGCSRSDTFGTIARSHIEALSNTIGARIAGTAAEAQAASYIFDEFTRLGYEPVMDNFTASYETTTGQATVDSANVIAEKRGQSDQIIIVGAHYDSVDTGQGADDNASGIGVMLEVAERIIHVETPYTVRFVAFGAEEVGLLGSYHYVDNMTADDIENTIAYFNMDSLLAGDITYIYGNFGADGTIRDWALDWASSHGYNLQTQVGLNPDYPIGTTGPFSDHVAFEEAGIQYAYFEATNWTLGELDGYTQVDPQYGVEGEVWHTQFDTLAYLDETFPGRANAHLELFTRVLYAVLTEYKQPGSA